MASRWRVVVELASTGVDHRDVGERIVRAGAISGGYLMMTAISASIAILGLLLSSPAVVIGAMLLSPLMGPIVLLGLSFWTVDWLSTRKALAGLGAGFGIALAVSIALTVLSPLKEPTAEILARSRPTLFDLLVAIFSGVAGGYAVVRGRGETVIGVAIATALMPPLAVVGFGVGTRAWSIAGGALLLFFTNLIAIALAAAVVAAVSGFRPHVHLAHRGWVRHVAVLAILAVLCVPLTLSMHTIALESQATADARAEIGRLFDPKARITSLAVRYEKRVINVESLVATPAYVENAPARLVKALRSRLHAPVKVSLGQVVLADPSKLKPTPAPSPAAPLPPDPAEAAAADLRAAVPFEGTRVAYDPGSDVGLVLLGSESGLDLKGARALEDGLRRRSGGEKTIVTPPVEPLPAAPLAVPKKGTVVLGPVDLQLWALARWRSPSVDAQLCRGRLRAVRIGDVQKAIVQAFAPLPVTIAQGSRKVCTAMGERAPFLLLSPGPPLTPDATPPGGATATSSAGPSSPRSAPRPASIPPSPP